MRWATAEDVQNIAPAVNRKTAHVMADSLNFQLGVKDAWAKETQMLCFLAMRRVLEFEGHITPEQSIQLCTFAKGIVAQKNTNFEDENTTEED